MVCLLRKHFMSRRMMSIHVSLSSLKFSSVVFSYLPHMLGLDVLDMSRDSMDSDSLESPKTRLRPNPSSPSNQRAREPVRVVRGSPSAGNTDQSMGKNTLAPKAPLAGEVQNVKPSNLGHIQDCSSAGGVESLVQMDLRRTVAMLSRKVKQVERERDILASQLSRACKNQDGTILKNTLESEKAAIEDRYKSLHSKYAQVCSELSNVKFSLEAAKQQIERYHTALLREVDNDENELSRVLALVEKKASLQEPCLSVTKQQKLTIAALKRRVSVLEGQLKKKKKQSFWSSGSAGNSVPGTAGSGMGAGTFSSMGGAPSIGEAPSRGGISDSCSVGSRQCGSLPSLARSCNSLLVPLSASPSVAGMSMVSHNTTSVLRKAGREAEALKSEIENLREVNSDLDRKYKAAKARLDGFDENSRSMMQKIKTLSEKSSRDDQVIAEMRVYLDKRMTSGGALVSSLQSEVKRLEGLCASQTDLIQMLRKK